MPHQNTKLYNIVKTRTLLYVFSALSLFLANFFLVLVPYIGNITIDQIILDNPLSKDDFIQSLINQLGGVAFLSQNLWICGALIVAATFLNGICMYLKDYFSATACEQIVRGLRDELYQHIHHLPNKFHNEVDTGDLLQRCTSDIDTLREFLTVNVMTRQS